MEVVFVILDLWIEVIFKLEFVDELDTIVDVDDELDDDVIMVTLFVLDALVALAIRELF